MTQPKDKILFWLENYSIHFGIAKALSEQYDCDLYALVSCSPKQKKFFNTQKLVKFEKVWYVRDYVDLKKQNPNLENIKFFEKKFSISLSRIIYGDRLFYKYNKYYSFTDKEIFSIIEQELEFYNQVLDEIKPDYVILRAPEFQDIELFYEICKAKKIKTLVLSTMKFGSRWIIASKPYPTIEFNQPNNQIEIKRFDILRKEVDEYSKLYKNIFLSTGKMRVTVSQKFAALKLLFSTFSNSNINSYHDLGKSPWKIFIKTISTMLKGSYRKWYLGKNTKTSLPLNSSYVYFPLHVEPDVSILRIGDFYEDQFSVIKNISQSLPIEMNLFVKEHPAMWLMGWRSSEFYKKISQLPKVELIHPYVSNESLLQNSSLVITIAGTVALEATFYEKSCIVFSDINCSSISSVFKINNLKDLPQLILKALDSKVNLVELNHYVNEIEKSTFISNAEELNALSAVIFGIGGLLNMNEISEFKMKEFLQKHKNAFDILATEHIKKLEHLKKII